MYQHLVGIHNVFEAGRIQKKVGKEGGRKSKKESYASYGRNSTTLHVCQPLMILKTTSVFYSKCYAWTKYEMVNTYLS